MQTSQRKPGDLAFFYSGEYHLNDHTQYPSLNLSVEFNHSFLKEYDLSEEHIRKAFATGSNLLVPVLNTYSELLSDANQGSATLAILGLLSLDPNDRRSPPPVWVTDVRDYLHDNWNTNPSLQELSTLTGAHPVTVSKYFKRYFSCSLSTYLRQIKVSKALAMLKSTSASLEFIAFECGFSDKSHLSRSIKAETGILPSIYRQW